MGRHTRKYWLQDETGIVYVRRRGRQLSDPAPPTLNANVWLDQGDKRTIWLVNFEVHPAYHETTTATQTVDGWELNSGRWLIYIRDGTLRVSNELLADHTPRFIAQPTSATLPLSVNEVTGELLHGNP